MKKNCAALILAAGNSSRMGTPKLFLKLNNEKTFLENITQQYDIFGCREIIVVLNITGLNLLKSRQQKLPSQTQLVLNSNPNFGRFYSVKIGIEQVSTSHTFIHNIDNPTLKPEVLDSLYSSKNQGDVIKPVLNTKGGHPILLSKKVCENILKIYENDIILKDFLRQFVTIDINVKSNSIFENINTNYDYRKLINTDK